MDQDLARLYGTTSRIEKTAAEEAATGVLELMVQQGVDPARMSEADLDKIAHEVISSQNEAQLSQPFLEKAAEFDQLGRLIAHAEELGVSSGELANHLEKMGGLDGLRELQANLAVKQAQQG